MKRKGDMKVKVSLQFSNCFSTVPFEWSRSCLRSPWTLFGACNTSTGWWRCGNTPKVSLIHLKLLLWKHPVKSLDQLPLDLWWDFLGCWATGKSLQGILVNYWQPVCFPSLPSIFPILFNFPAEAVYPKEIFLDIWVYPEALWKI